MRWQPKLWDLQREKKKENFTAKGSNVQTGLLTQQMTEQI